MTLASSIGLGQSIGRRERQEDCIARLPPEGARAELLVLSDGMGGAAAGDLAGRLIVHSVLQVYSRARAPGVAPTGGILRAGAERANKVLQDRAEAEPELKGMGGTLLTVRLLPLGIQFFSMGDSPLYLVRRGHAYRMNADHSIGGILDAAVARGEMSAQDAMSRRDRNSIISVIMGEPISTMRMDETIDIVPIRPDDTLILASDGLDTLLPEAIGQIAQGGANATAVVDGLLRAVEAADRPRQDNTSVIVARF